MMPKLKDETKFRINQAIADFQTHQHLIKSKAIK